MDTKMSQQDMQEILDIWAQNVFPDVILQSLALKLLSSVFDCRPELREETRYFVPPVDDWDLPGHFVPRMEGINQIKVQNLFKDWQTNAALVAGVINMITTHRCVIKGTVRLMLVPEKAHLLTIRLMWLDYTGDDHGRKRTNRGECLTCPKHGWCAGFGCTLDSDAGGRPAVDARTTAANDAVEGGERCEGQSQDNTPA